MKSRLSLLALTLAAAMLVSGTVKAQQAEDNAKKAKDLFAYGIKNYDEGKYQIAVQSFREAYRLRPSWKLLYNIGQAESSLGKFGPALEVFQQYMVEGKDEIPQDRRDYVVAEIRRLEALVGDVTVVAPDGAVIYVDGVERGVAPLSGPLLVESGTEHLAMISLPSGKTWTKKFKERMGSKPSTRHMAYSRTETPEWKNEKAIGSVGDATLYSGTEGCRALHVPISPKVS